MRLHLENVEKNAYLMLLCNSTICFPQHNCCIGSHVAVIFYQMDLQKQGQNFP